MPMQPLPEKHESFSSFEQRLKGALQPVRPESAFSDQLKRRISNVNLVTMERESKAFSLLAMALGILIGALGIILLSKLIFRRWR